MSETVPEQRSESCLPPAVPGDLFENALHAKIVDAWWNDPSLLCMRHAIPTVLDAMTPAELLAFGQLLQADYLEPGDRNHYVSVWGTPTEYTIDEEGLVHAAFAPVTQVKEYIQSGLNKRDVEAETAIYDLEDAVHRSLRKAAELYRNEGFADTLADQIEDEEDRRTRLAKQIKLANAS